MSNNLNVLPVPPSELPNSSTNESTNESANDFVDESANESANDSTDNFVDEVIYHTGCKLANLIFQDKFVKNSNNNIMTVGAVQSNLNNLNNITSLSIVNYLYAEYNKNNSKNINNLMEALEYSNIQNKKFVDTLRVLIESGNTHFNNLAKMTPQNRKTYGTANNIKTLITELESYKNNKSITYISEKSFQLYSTEDIKANNETNSLRCYYIAGSAEVIKRDYDTMIKPISTYERTINNRPNNININTTIEDLNQYKHYY
jgi:hypothetical protein